MMLEYRPSPKPSIHRNRIVQLASLILFLSAIIIGGTLAYIYGWQAVGRYMRSPEGRPTYGTPDRIFRALP
jgi:hypothetical protein